MSQADLSRWDARYRAGAYASRAYPTPLLEDHVASLPRGRALDVACGTGRNALYLAAAGYEVDAIDISPTGLERARAAALVRGLRVNWIEADLDSGLDAATAARSDYALIVMVRYVNMALIPQLIDRLSEGGMFLCEQHLVSGLDVVGPSNPAYRLESNELLRAARDLKILFYREGVIEDPDGRRASLAQLIGANGTTAEIVYR